MSAKAPPIYLKRGGRKGKRAKLREVLSCDMISPPLGDFRHTIHVGSGGEGDTFGDVSFLRGKFHLLPRAEPPPTASSSSSSSSSFRFARTSTLGERPASSEADSPLLKNAVSLPVLGAPQALALPAAPPKPPRLHLDERVGVEEEEEEEKEEEERGAEPFLPHAGSLLSLHVDLGPSILEDVLQVMEKHQAEGAVQILT